MVDIHPIDVISLYGDHIMHVLPIFVPVDLRRPSQFHDDDIFNRWEKSVVSSEFHPLSPAESFLVEWIVGQVKQLNCILDADNLDEMTFRQRCRLKAQLWIKSKRRSQSTSDFRNVAR